MTQTVQDILEEISEFRAMVFIHEGGVFSIYEPDEIDYVESEMLTRSVKEWKVTNDDVHQIMIVDIYI